MIPKGPMGASVPNPNLSDNMLAFSIAQNLFAALSNHVQGGATVQANQAVIWTPITSPLITRKSSGIFVIVAVCTISLSAGGNLADGDVVTYNLQRTTPGAVALTPIWRTAASTSTGGGANQTVVANLSAAFIDTTTAALGSTSSYSIQVSNQNGHGAGVVAATDGNIWVVELPG